MLAAVDTFYCAVEHALTRPGPYCTWPSNKGYGSVHHVLPGCWYVLQNLDHIVSSHRRAVYHELPDLDNIVLGHWPCVRGCVSSATVSFYWSVDHELPYYTRSSTSAADLFTACCRPVHTFYWAVDHQLLGLRLYCNGSSSLWYVSLYATGLLTHSTGQWMMS